MHKIPSVLSWSGGKDCNLALDKIVWEQQYEVRYLLTTFHLPAKVVNMHGIHESLIEAQAETLGIPLIKVYLQSTDNKHYEAVLEAALLPLKKRGIRTLIFGDIFLEDLRIYREQLMYRLGFESIFPLWKKDTKLLAEEFILKKMEAIVCCVDLTVVPEALSGASFNKDFLSKLPQGVDPCGENGEFHTFCYDAPLFKNRLAVHPGTLSIEVVNFTAQTGTNQPIEKKGFALRQIILNKPKT